MRIVLLCGPPCSGKTTLAHRIAAPGDLVLDYDDVARLLGSPVQWIHPEPLRTVAEQEMQVRIAQAYSSEHSGTAWVIRTAPRPAQRAALAHQWQASVYLLNPGRAECLRRAVQAGRPSGTRRSIGEWYYRYSPWSGDRDPVELDSGYVSARLDRGMVEVDPMTV